MDWSDIFAWAMGRTAVARVGFVSIFFFTLRDAVSKIHGSKQALASVTGLVPWRRIGIGRSLGFAVTLLLSEFSLVEFGRFFGRYPM